MQIYDFIFISQAIFNFFRPIHVIIIADRMIDMSEKTSKFVSEIKTTDEEE